MGKEVFVMTTNVDGQFFKAGFDPGVVYTPQGDYGMLQCETPCNNVLHDNRQMVETLIRNWDANRLLVRESDIPRCPACGGYLERNLRACLKIRKTRRFMRDDAVEVESERA
jgi:NAD-dependent SIR2 family protein deacetylase